MIGEHVGSIRIERQLGEGGMGEVYLGFDEKLGRRVAVKTLRREGRFEVRARERLLREAQILSQLGHPGICQLYDYVAAGDSDFLVLEYVEGKNLAELPSASLPLAVRLDYAIQLAEALAAAHRQLIIHRDLKAENVMVTPDGVIKVLDLGLARREAPTSHRSTGRPPELAMPTGATRTELAIPLALRDTESPLPMATSEGVGRFGAATLPDPLSGALTRQGVVLGTLRSMSPEQASGALVSTATDLFALGLLLQELFTGRPAYPHLPVGELWARVQSGRTEPIVGLDGELSQLLRELLSLDPAVRPTAAQAAERLRQLVAKPERVRRQRLRRRLLAAGLSALGVVLAVVAMLAVAATRAREEAERRREQAEELLAFVVDDLRPRLERVGRLDLLDAVGERALGYFAAVPENELTSSELARRLEVLRQVAEVRVAQGQVERGAAVVDQAIALAAERPQEGLSGVGLWRLAQLHGARGAHLFEEAGPAAALSAFETQTDLARRLVREAPPSDDYRRELLAALANQGAALAELRRFGEAREVFAEARIGYRELIDRGGGEPALLAQFADLLAWASSNEHAAGDLDRAVALRQENLELLGGLASRQSTPTVRNDLAVARDFLAKLYLSRGDLALAEAEDRAALTLFAELAAGDPENADWQRNLAGVQGNLGWLLWLDRRPQEAVLELAAARERLTDLVARSPDNRVFRRLRASAAGRLGEVTVALGHPGAEALLEEGEREVQALLLADPNDTRSRLTLAEVLRGRIALARSRGELAAVPMLAQRALALLGDDPEAEDGNLMLRVRMALVVGDRQAAGRALASLEHRRPGSRQVAELAALLAAESAASRVLPPR